MLSLLTPYIIGIAVGVAVAFATRTLRHKAILVRLILGIAGGIGVSVLINASIEVVSLFSSADPVAEDDMTKTPLPVVVAPATANALAADEQWEQQQRSADGTLQATRTVTRNAAGQIVAHGPASTYHPDGLLKWQGNFNMGKQMGKWREFYRDGSREGEGEISPDGTAVETHWYANGQRKSQGSWKDGRKHGTWTTWGYEGELAGVYVFENGMPTTVPAKD